MSDQKQKNREQESEDFDAGFQIPETKEVLGKLEGLLRSSHELQMAEKEKEDDKKGKKKEKRRNRGGSICCCGCPTCSIGPFVERVS